MYYPLYFQHLHIMGLVDLMAQIFLDNPAPIPMIQAVTVRALASQILYALDLPVSLDSLLELLSLHILHFLGEPLPPSIFAPIRAAITVMFLKRYP